MTMKRKVAAGGLAATLAVTGIAATTVGVAWAGNSTNATATTDPSDAPARTSMIERITEALAGLVEDGTITEDQASAVAEELAASMPMRGGPPGAGQRGGGPGGGSLHRGGPHGMLMEGARLALETAAETLGMDGGALRAALRDGSSLADLAEQQGVAVDDVVAALVDEAEEHLAQAVADGRITQERADEIAATLSERLTERLDQTWEPRGHGPRGGPFGMSEGSGG